MGPPGTGLTSLGESVAPVILLDELDKVAPGIQGDPTAALLEVLDPAQNHTFRDNYLEVDLDLSDVLFIGTANVADTIPGPLLDRLEVITLDGDTEREKKTITRGHLLPRQRHEAGLSEDELEITDEALDAVIDGYTREPGVRGLEQALDKLSRKVATRLATGQAEGPVDIGPDEVRELLGKRTVRPPIPDNRALPGLVTGLAVTGAGGEVLQVEASVSDGEPGVTTTGQLGDVMHESAEIAASWVRANAEHLGGSLAVGGRTAPAVRQRWWAPPSDQATAAPTHPTPSR
jgi:ATP-dependent Lon protease